MGYIWDLLKNGKDKKNDNYSSGDPTKVEIDWSHHDTSTLSSIKIEDSGLACHNHEDDIVVCNIDDVEKKELLETIVKLTLENSNLKCEVKMLDDYIKHLEDNFHFVLKDCKLAKKLFDGKIMGGMYE